MKKISIIILSIVLLSCHRNYRPPIKTGFEGQTLPSFNLLLSDSSTHLNTGDIPKGQPIVMLFLSPQCPYCRAELTGILKNISSFNGVKFYVFTNWPFTQFKSFYTTYELSKYKNIVAGQDYTNFFLTHFSAMGVPYTAIYNKNKKLSKAFMGIMPAEQIKELTQND